MCHKLTKTLCREGMGLHACKGHEKGIILDSEVKEDITRRMTLEWFYFSLPGSS